MRNLVVALSNQLSWQRIFFSLVTDFMRKGEETASLTFLKRNDYWIRNAGILYKIETVTENADVTIGIVGRNLLISKPAGAFNPENFNFATKSISLNLNFTMH